MAPAQGDVLALLALQRQKYQNHTSSVATTDNVYKQNNNSHSSSSTLPDGQQTAQDDVDYSWMNNEPEDDGEVEALTVLRNELLQRKRAGKINDRDALELLRVTERMKVLRRMLTRVEENVEAEESLFVSDGPDSNSNSVDGDEYEDRDPDSNTALMNMLSHGVNDGGAERAGETRPKRRRAKATKNAREYHERERQRDIERERKRVEREKVRTQAASKKGNRGKGKKVANAKNKKKPGTVESLLKKRSWGKEDDFSHCLLDNLRNDPISERLRNPVFDIEDEPAIDARDKTSQFKQLLTNVPTVVPSRGDQAKLKRASHSFGHSMIKALDGKWLMKG